MARVALGSLRRTTCSWGPWVFMARSLRVVYSYKRDTNGFASRCSYRPCRCWGVARVLCLSTPATSARQASCCSPFCLCPSLTPIEARVWCPLLTGLVVKDLDQIHAIYHMQVIRYIKLFLSSRLGPLPRRPLGLYSLAYSPHVTQSLCQVMLELSGGRCRTRVLGLDAKLDHVRTKQICTRQNNATFVLITKLGTHSIFHIRLAKQSRIPRL